MHGSTVHATGPFRSVHGIDEGIQDQKTQFEKHILVMKSLQHFQIYNLFTGILIDRYSLKNFPPLSHVMACFFGTLTVIEVIKCFFVMERYADI